MEVEFAWGGFDWEKTGTLGCRDGNGEPHEGNGEKSRKPVYSWDREGKVWAQDLTGEVGRNESSDNKEWIM